MLDLIHRLVRLDLKRQGATLREIPVLGANLWYADLPPARPLLGRRAMPEVPTLVLIHGLGSSAVTFHPVLRFLRRDYRIIIPDLPGGGASTLPKDRPFLRFDELLEVMDRFIADVAPDGTYLAGNSMGGWIAAKLAVRQPKIVKGLALLNPAGPELEREDWNDFESIIRAENREAVRIYFSRLFHRPPWATRLFESSFLEVIRAPPVSGMLRDVVAQFGKGGKYFLSRKEAQAIRCPTMLVWGDADRLIPAGCFDFYETNLPNLRAERLPETGHCPQLERPKRTAELIIELKEMPAAPKRRASGVRR